MYFFQLIYPSLGFKKWARACVSLMCEVSPSSSALENNWLNAPWPWGFVEFGIEHNETWRRFAISPPFTSIHLHSPPSLAWKATRMEVCWTHGNVWGQSGKTTEVCEKQMKATAEGGIWSIWWCVFTCLYCRIVLHRSPFFLRLQFRASQWPGHGFTM